ncbi:MAG: sulfatase-like hydrolase/transferase [Eubacteriales bacterium]
MKTLPNIIFFFTDQQRWDTVGCYGQTLPVTPNLDQMAQEGVKFENAFTCQPVCGPARACLQTGKYATGTGCYKNDMALFPDEKTIAHYFSEAGYEVGYIGKWHLASQGDQFNYRTKPVPPQRRGGYKDFWLASDVLEFTSHGYDGYMYDGDMNKVEFKGYRADCMTDYALDYLRSRDGKKPFFLFLSYIEPHHQNDRNAYEGPIGSKEKFKDYIAPSDLADTGGDWRENYPDYLGCCNSLDYNLGRVRDEINKRGLAENTVIIYTSDHGTHFRTRNKEYKRSCHESSIRIPMIAYGPGFTGGRIIDDLVSLIDIPPTLLACGNIDKPEPMKGRPLQQLIDGDGSGWPSEIFFQISESQVGRGIRTKRWKYSVYAPDKDGVKDSCCDVYEEQFLYDLENDPHEKNNLAGHKDYELIRKQLSGILIKRMAEAGEQIPVITPHG